MKSFYLVVNWAKDQAAQTAKQIQTYLEKKGACCYVGNPFNGQEHRAVGYTDPQQVPEGVEGVLTLGGDGTLIQAARDLALLKLPILGVNLGTLGYLAQISVQDGRESLERTLDLLIDGEYQLEERMMLDGCVWRGNQIHYQNLALNEIVITGKDVLKVMKFRIYVNGEFLSCYTADGIIAATPTGSTAYNLSAGGPIVSPAAKMTIVTPICAHSLNDRSIVLPAEDRITIAIEHEADRRPVAVFDGDGVEELALGDSVDICRSNTTTTMIRLKHTSFLENLRNKMSTI